jgi:hypothetical protein
VQPLKFIVRVEVLPLRIDESAIEAHPARDRFEDVIGALAELEVHRVIGMYAIDLAHPNEVDRVLHDLVVRGPERVRREHVAPHSTHPGVDLPGDQKSIEKGDFVREKVFSDAREEILVASERVPTEVIDRVVVD